ncbi:cell surface protein [Phlyctema vagabunda]|uniref:Cell surface protein n=1 Tax=Phlyctema vagabunda TaxID=108571 RepID=A0ABR4PLY5_9HELO
MTNTHNTGNESTLDKIKDKLHIGGHKDTTTTTSTTHTTGTTHNTTGHGTSTNAGPHDSNVANKADPRIDSDRDNRANPASHVPGTTGHSTTGHTTAGHNTTGHTTGTGYGTSTNAGPHDSNLANKADPRIDSDRDNRANPSSHVGGTTGHNTTGHTGTGYGTSTNAGPHDSNLANKADPRFDSDRDNRANPASHVGGTGAGYGTTGTHTGTGHTGTHTGATGTGYGSTGAGYGTSTNAGPHDSNLLNKADPRVDSDRDNRANPTSSAGAGYGTTGTHSGTSGTHAGNHGLTGQTGTHNTGGLSNSTNAGPHNSNAANKADPRVDSDLDGKGNRHGASSGGVFGASGSHATHGSGTAQNTDGPHNSDLLNKVDPRVDSDRDGSKTVGGNKTHA